MVKALEHPQAQEALLGIEVCNMNPTHSPFNQRSQNAALLPLAHIASSDAHIASMIGAGVTHFDGLTAQDLRHAIQRRATKAEQINHEKPMRIFIRWLGLYIRRKINEVFARQETEQRYKQKAAD
jgi:hypothetical protein